MALPRPLRRAVAVTGAAALAATLTVGTAAAPAGAASDSAIAKAGVIVQSDLGSQWSGAPADESGNKLALKAAAEYPECKDYILLNKLNRKQPNADSKDWTLDDQSISDKSFVYSSESAAKKAMTLAKSPDMADCLTSSFQSLLGDQLAKSPEASKVARFNVLIDEVTGLPATGDDIAGYAGGVEITYKDGTVEQLLTGTALVRVGRVLLTYSFSAPPSATDYTSALDSAIENTVSRTEKAQK